MRFGVLTDSMRNNISPATARGDAAMNLQQEVKQLYVKPPANVVNPSNNIQEQQRLTQLENQYKLPAGILNNVYQAESGGGKNLYSPAGAEGPFQFMPSTGQQYGLNTTNDRLDFNKSSDAAAHYLSDLLIKFNGDVQKLLQHIMLDQITSANTDYNDCLMRLEIISIKLCLDFLITRRSFHNHHKIMESQ